MIENHRSSKLEYLAFSLVACVGLFASEQVIQKFLHGAILKLAVNGFVFCGILYLPALAKLKISKSKWLLIAMVAVFFLEALFLYPIADGRKAIHSGSDEDDAIIVAADQMRALHFPYAQKTYLGGPISPGPGWIMLNIPAIKVHLYALQGPLLLALLAWMLRRRSAREAFLFVAVLLFCPAIHLLISNGSDLVALSAAFMLFGVSVYQQRSLFACIGWSVLLGFVATARINLIAVPVAMLCMRKDWKTARAWMETAIAVMTAACLHAAFYLHAPSEYAPFHLIAKGRMFLDAVPLLAVLLPLVLVVFVLWFKAETGAQMVGGLAIFLFIAHLPAAMGVLRLQQYRFAIWDGFEYISLCLVCASGAVACFAPSQGKVVLRST